MVADGWGYNQIAAARSYIGSNPSYQSSDFTSVAMSTYSASNTAGYNTQTAWTSDGAGGLKPNYETLKSGTGATDSAAAITAMMTGEKTYDGRINWSTSGQRLTTFADSYKISGHSVGAVTTVPWSHATPSGVMGHNISRGNYSELANEMVNSSIDVVMGAGNPGYDDNSNPAVSSALYVGGAATWNALKAGTSGGLTPWTLIEDRSAFQALASGATPNRVLGAYKSYTSMQQARSGDGQTVDIEGRKTVVPTLAEMSKAALNVLDNNPKGFFLMIEGGAVDYANHANQKGRLIEEMLDFNSAVDAVVNYINSNSNWEETLLIVAGDHECGLLLGPNGETDIVGTPTGSIPSMKYFSGSHSNQLIPLYARGAGSELLSQYAVKTDLVRGKYIDNTDVFKLMTAATAAPATTTLPITIGAGPGYGGARNLIELHCRLEGSTQYTGTLSLDRNGRTTIDNILPGRYTITLSGSHWLNRIIKDVNVNGANSLIVALVNGDSDGNGQINLFDFVVLDSKFGSSDAMADLNGDGVVNLFDYVIIDQNFGAQGDK